MTVAIKPGLAKCAPERAESHDTHTRWFQTWCVENHVSVDDIQRLFKLKSRSTAMKKWTGESPLSFIDIAFFPSRYRHQLTSMWNAWRDSLDRDARGLARHG